MQSFSFRSDYDENQNIERIITERNRRIAKQQVIFALVFFFLLVMLGWYIFRKAVYSDFDGYVQTEFRAYRAVEDIYLFDQYKNVGDIVLPGDTLYSYLLLRNFIGLEDLNSEPNVVVNDRNLRLQSSIASTEANVLRVRIRELEAQIAREDNNIRFGLTDNSHKMDLQRELAETREALNAMLNRMGIYSNIRRETDFAVRRFGMYETNLIDEQIDNQLFEYIYKNNKRVIRYSVARDTSIVTKVWVPPFSRVFKTEPIVQLEALSLSHSNMQVVAYIPTGDMKHVNNHTQAEVIVNDDVSFTATVQLLGARTEELPEQLRNSLSHTYTTVMVVFQPDEGQVLPLWAAVDHVPVKVRIRNFNNGARHDGSDYYYLDRSGLTEESKYHLGLIERRPDSAAETAEAAEPEPGPQPEPAAEPDEAQRYVEHVIAKGETLYRIADQYDVDVRRILDHNPDLDPDRIIAGRKLRIPVNGDAE